MIQKILFASLLFIILAPPTENEDNNFVTIPFEIKHATPQPFQKYESIEHRIQQFDDRASKTDGIDIGGESNTLHKQITGKDKIDVDDFGSAISFDNYQSGFLTPVILPKTTLHNPPLM